MTAIPSIQIAAQQAATYADAPNKATSSVLQGGEVSPSYQTPFASILQDAVEKTQQLETNAANTVTGLLSGQGVDVHTAMIATEKANLGFEMMLAFRNKAVAAYQQLMGLQF
ncbi:MAG TPA: flagellar hook-basal body complex protein FliE [Acidobacteriaceae bacterium]|nr:flagellar hook-basal body complex protein FliE [Terriglobia bacterium]HVC91237.1 flagellar hook-basal body complex protein FliE [Acidobacteriaceae bacterium]